MYLYATYTIKIFAFIFWGHDSLVRSLGLRVSSSSGSLTSSNNPPCDPCATTRESPEKLGVEARPRAPGIGFEATSRAACNSAFDKTSRLRIRSGLVPFHFLCQTNYPGSVTPSYIVIEPPSGLIATAQTESSSPHGTRVGLRVFALRTSTSMKSGTW